MIYLAPLAQNSERNGMSQDVVTLLQELVRIPSVNPDNTPGTDQVGEEKMAVFLSGWLESIGAEVILEEVRPGRPNLIARFAPMDGRPRMMYAPHLDTVGVEGMTIDPFSGEVRDGKLWGRGSSDTKGPMSAMLWSLHENQDILENLPIAMDFVAFMGEESGQWGSKAFAGDYGSVYEFAVVGEPTEMTVVHQNKGSTWATLRATGKAVHSSMPENGDNAILKLSRAINQLNHCLVPELARFTHPNLGCSTINFGTIRGGSRANIVPDCCEAEIDIRFTPSLHDAGGALKILKDAIADHDLPIEIINPHENPPLETPANLPGIQRLLNNGSSLASAPWFSDAAHLSAGGIPSICIGPGSIHQAHTVDEHIDIEALRAGTDFFTDFVRRLAE